MLKKMLHRWRIPLLVITGVFLAAVARWPLLPFQNNDLTQAFIPWYDFIKNHGFLNAFQYKFSDYTPLYLHLLALTTLLPMDKLYAIKAVSLVFEGLAAGAVYKILRTHRAVIPAVYGGLLLLFTPTVVLNGAFWGQSDIIYTTWILLSLLGLARGKNHLAFLFYGLALATKPQAFFIAPFYILMVMLVPSLNFWYLLYLPVVYILTLVPSLAAGRSFWEMITLPFYQSGRWPSLTLNAPNIYQWLPQTPQMYQWFKVPGFALTAAALLLFGFAAYERLHEQKRPPSFPQIIQLMLIISLITPFCLPQMHERYFFLADILSLLYIFCFPGRAWVYILITGCSLLSYFPFLFQHTVVPLPWLALVLGGVLAFLLHAFWTDKSLP